MSFEIVYCIKFYECFFAYPSLTRGVHDGGYASARRVSLKAGHSLAIRF